MSILFWQSASFSRWGKRCVCLPSLRSFCKLVADWLSAILFALPLDDFLVHERLEVSLQQLIRNPFKSYDVLEPAYFQNINKDQLCKLGGVGHVHSIKIR